MRRVAEERNWLHLTVAIIAGFIVSVVPVFLVYMLSVFHVRIPPYVVLAVWWLLISGSFINLLIYTYFMKKSIAHARDYVMFKIGVGADPRPHTTYNSSTTKMRTFQSRQESLPLNSVLETETLRTN